MDQFTRESTAVPTVVDNSVATPVAPAIAALGKIEPTKRVAAAAAAAPSLPPASETQRTNTPKSERIVVPTRSLNGGLDFKFESDPYGVKLRGLLTPEQYTDAITRINDTLRPSRSTKVDAALLATGPLMVPLALWGVRHSGQAKRRKNLLKECIDQFNSDYPYLLMRWNRRPESFLTIERRTADHVAAPPPPPSSTLTSMAGGVVDTGTTAQALGGKDLLV